MSRDVNETLHDETEMIMPRDETFYKYVSRRLEPRRSNKVYVTYLLAKIW